MDAPVLRILQLFKDRSIERLTDAKHSAFAGIDGRAIADLVGLMLSLAWSLGPRMIIHFQSISSLAS
jgi:hypothetical protein